MTGSGRPIRIATRASHLALWQAHHTADLIRAAAPERTVELVHVSTTGDRVLNRPMRELGSFGIFTREVQSAVLENRADIAVHSLKDLPTEPVPGLTLAAVPRRGDVFDVLVLAASNPGQEGLESLPKGAKIGTGSLRRQAQVRHVRPDLLLLEIRGNVETRLRKLDDAEYDAIILAAAGLQRLGLGDRARQELKPPVMYPAVSQGAIGIEARAEDAEVREILAHITDAPTYEAVTAERSLLSELRAGCHAPLGVFSRRAGDLLLLEAVVLSPDGTTRLTASASIAAAEDPDAAATLGRLVAEQLREQGADALITAARP